MQPYEFLQLADGALWRKDQQKEIAAYFVSCLMNIHIDPKKRISPQTLLKPLRSDKETADIANEEKAYFKDAFGLS